MIDNLKVIAFDCDGVMFDTRKANTAYYNRILKKFDRPELTEEQFHFVQMHTVDESISYLFDEPLLLEKARTFRQEMSYRPFIKYMEIEPSLKSLISDVGDGFKWAIATNRTDTMDMVLSEHGLSDYFDLVLTALDVDHPKPDPELLNKILTYFKAEPSQAIYVGDSKLDELAARGAGIPLVAYKNKSLDAAYHIQSLDQIKDIIKP